MKLKDLLDDFADLEITKEQANEIKNMVLPEVNDLYKIRMGDDYYFCKLDGSVQKYTWTNADSEKHMRSIGRVFLTEDEAMDDYERNVVENLLIKYGGRRKRKPDVDNWCIDINFNGELNVNNFTYSYPQGVIYFDSEEELEKAVLAIGKERIVNALFKIEEE